MVTEVEQQQKRLAERERLLQEKENAFEALVNTQVQQQLETLLKDKEAEFQKALDLKANDIKQLEHQLQQHRQVHEQYQQLQVQYKRLQQQLQVQQQLVLSATSATASTNSATANNLAPRHTRQRSGSLPSIQPLAMSVDSLPRIEHTQTLQYYIQQHTACSEVFQLDVARGGSESFGDGDDEDSAPSPSNEQEQENQEGQQQQQQQEQEQQQQQQQQEQSDTRDASATSMADSNTSATATNTTSTPSTDSISTTSGNVTSTAKHSGAGALENATMPAVLLSTSPISIPAMPPSTDTTPTSSNNSSSSSSQTLGTSWRKQTRSVVVVAGEGNDEDGLFATPHSAAAKRKKRVSSFLDDSSGMTITVNVNLKRKPNTNPSPMHPLFGEDSDADMNWLQVREDDDDSPFRRRAVDDEQPSSRSSMVSESPLAATSSPIAAKQTSGPVVDGAGGVSVSPAGRSLGRCQSLTAAAVAADPIAEDLFSTSSRTTSRYIQRNRKPKDPNTAAPVSALSDSIASSLVCAPSNVYL
jgi:hypothetical protein